MGAFDPETGDHCCKATVAECDPAGERIASIMLGLELPEWIGRLPPELVELLITTSTMDAWIFYLIMVLPMKLVGESRIITDNQGLTFI